MKNRNTCPGTTDLSALASDIRKLGPEAALPNKLPQKWLMSIARDVVMARALELAHPDDPGPSADRLAPIVAMIVTILGAQNSSSDAARPFPELSLGEEEVFEYIEIYKFLILEELAARTTGAKAGGYNLMSIFQPEPAADSRTS